jgi:RecB family endonuclease NucS
VGKSDGFNYPHQKAVKWLKKPREFLKKYLPENISKQMGKRGKTTIKISTNYNGEDFIRMLENLSIPSYEGKYNEELVKAGLSKYVKRNLEKLEDGLTIEREEKSIDKENRPDFIAKDRNGKKVIIECKGSLADLSDISQVINYLRSYGQEARYFLIAFSFNERCLEKAKKTKIELIECDLVFKKKV